MKGTINSKENAFNELKVKRGLVTNDDVSKKKKNKRVRKQKQMVVYKKRKDWK